MLKNETKISYALALLDIAKEKGHIKEFYKESNILIEVLDEQLEFQKILDSFSLDDDSKMKIIDKTFKGFDISFINTIKILSLKNNFKCFREILNYLIDYLQNILNIKKCIVYSTTKISEPKMKKIKKKLEDEYGKEINLKNLIDKELIGGFKIVIDSTVIENSVSQDLDLLKKELKFKKEGSE
ncbi:MAG: F0F1 ATP synthase subunit delta [Mycoplasmataceae bacterium]|nr:F0F1 ATP synthase subunit delta [Mycoplasmataceae bacterium]